MRPLHEGATRRADARAFGRAGARGRAGRRRAATRSARLIGAIIAGGASSRFGGAPKGLHVVGGQRIIDRVAAAMGDVTTDIMIVSGAADAATWIPGVRAVADTRSERGSLVGIHSALVHAGGPVLVVAWDMPFVTRELLALLESRGRETPYAAVPRTPDGLEPLCAVYNPACLPVVEAALDAGDLRMHAMIERLPSYDPVDVAGFGEPGKLFFNVNDEADLIIAQLL